MSDGLSCNIIWGHTFLKWALQSNIEKNRLYKKKENLIHNSKAKYIYTCFCFVFINPSVLGCMDLELIPRVSEGDEPKIEFKDEMGLRDDLKKDWPLYVFLSPWFASQLILEIVLNHWCRVEVACWENRQLIDPGKSVCASSSSEALVYIHLQLPDVSGASKECVCGLFVLSEVLYPPWWDRAKAWRTWWWEVSVGFIRKHNPSGISHSSAASLCLNITV